MVRGALSGGVGGMISVGLNGQSLFAGFRQGAVGGALSSAATWGANEYRTNQFIKNHVDCLSCTGDDNVTQGLKELGQSPIGQKLFGTIADSGRRLEIWIGSDPERITYEQIGDVPASERVVPW